MGQSTTTMRDPAGEAGPPLPACSLIVCSRDRPRLLTDLVYSVVAGQERPREIIVVDQSRVKNVDLANRPPAAGTEVHYEWSRTVGVSRARNIGIRLARHDILVFTDDDMLATPGWFGHLVRGLLRAGTRSIVSGGVRSTEDNPDGFTPSITVDRPPMMFEGRVGRDVLYSGNMAMHRTTFDEVGLFDERLGPGATFPAAEDNDLGFRMLEAGYRIVHVPEAELLHRDWRSGRQDFLPLRWRYGVGQGAFLAKHFRSDDRYTMDRLVGTTKQSVGRCLRALLRHRRHALGDAVYVLGLWVGAARWLLTERRARSAPVLRPIGE